MLRPSQSSRRLFVEVLVMNPATERRFSLALAPQNIDQRCKQTGMILVIDLREYAANVSFFFLLRRKSFVVLCYA
jgi:hypothetical protein